MSDYIEPNGSGTIFVNTNKEKDSQPDRSGYITAHRDLKAGERVRLAGWLAARKDGSAVKDRHGNPILNLKMSDDISVADTTQHHGGGGETEPGMDELSDEIPFVSPWGIW